LDLRVRISSRKQFLGVLAGGSASTAEHPGQFLHATFAVELGDASESSALDDLFRYEVMPVPRRCHRG
jgi:hypothetical protein